MVSGNHQQQWQKIESMTQQMHVLSEEENWQGMIELESERQNLLKHYFAEPVTETEAAVIAEKIKEILHSDEKLMLLGQRKKDEAAEAVRKLSTNRQAINAYSHFRR